MTDKEMALALGEYIVQLLGRISALESVFMEHRITNPDGNRVEISWKDDANRIAREAAALELSAAQSRSLQQAIGAGTPKSELIRSLYRHFVEN